MHALRREPRRDPTSLCSVPSPLTQQTAIVLHRVHTRCAHEFPGTHVYAEQSITSDRVCASGRMAPGSKTSQWITGNRSIPGLCFRDMELTLKTGWIQPPNFRRLIALAADVSDVSIIENNRLRTIGQMSNSSNANADARPIQPSASSAKTDGDRASQQTSSSIT
jgi:hypothetical protein